MSRLNPKTQLFGGATVVHKMCTQQNNENETGWKIFHLRKNRFFLKICSGSNNVVVEINSTTTYVCLAHKGFEKKFRSTDQLAIEVSESSPT